MQVTSVEKSALVVGQVQQKAAFKVAQSKEFIEILTKNLYSNPLYAVVRETMCNAWDAHIAAGKTHIPIKAYVQDGMFIVEDFGTGIPHEKMAETYAVFGQSTKNNDEEQTGGFGLGCKAPFAIGDVFTVQNCYNGILTVYTCIKSDPANNGLPSITTVCSYPSKELGIKVGIPLNEDISPDRFRSYIQVVARLGDILVEGLDPEKNIKKNAELCKILPWDLYQNDPNLYASEKVFFIRYGNNVFPVDVNKISSPFKNRHSLHKYLFEAKPNSLDIAPSRESLVYTKKTLFTLSCIFTSLTNKIEREKKQYLVEVLAPDFNQNLKRVFEWGKFNLYIPAEAKISLYAQIWNTFYTEFPIKNPKAWKYFPKYPAGILKAFKEQDTNRRNYLIKKIFKEEKKSVRFWSKYDALIDFKEGCPLVDTVYLVQNLIKAKVLLKDKCAGFVVRCSVSAVAEKTAYYEHRGFKVVHIQTEPIAKKQRGVLEQKLSVLRFYRMQTKLMELEPESSIDCYIEKDFIYSEYIKKYYEESSVFVTRELLQHAFTYFNCVVAQTKIQVKAFKKQNIPSLEEFIKEKLNNSELIKGFDSFYELTIKNYPVIQDKYFLSKESYQVRQYYRYYLVLNDLHDNVDSFWKLPDIIDSYLNRFLFYVYLNQKMQSWSPSKQILDFIKKVKESILYETVDLNLPKELSKQQQKEIINILLRKKDENSECNSN